MSRDARLKIEVFGRVQGVAFRWYTRQEATRLGLRGTVRNRVDGSVLIQAEGPGDRLEMLLRWVRRGPDRARVDTVDFLWSDAPEDSGDGRGGDSGGFLITG